MFATVKYKNGTLSFIPSLISVKQFISEISYPPPPRDGKKSNLMELYICL